MPTVLWSMMIQNYFKMLQRTLTYENLKRINASSGLEALTIINAHKPDFLIVDWIMLIWTV